MVGMVGWIYIMFLEMSKKYREQARGGGKACIYGNLPILRKPQYINKHSYLNPINKKIGKVIERRYISRGQVRILTWIFIFTKGKIDIIMVCDGTG